MKKTSSHRRASSTRQKLLLAAPVLAAVTTPGAQAAIIFTSVNGGAGLTIDSSQKVYFSPVTQGYQTSFFSTYDFSLQTANSNPIILGNGLNDRVAEYSVSGYVYTFLVTAGTSINSSSGFLADYGYLLRYGTGQWDIGSHGYLGLRIDGTNYSWAEVSYNANSSLTLYGFAYDDSGAAITTPAIVPEPATTTALAGLLAGSAAAFAYRKRRAAQRAA